MAPGHSPASCRICLERLRQQWPAFRDRVELLLARRASRRIAGTRIVATILKDLFTTALDWPRSCIRARLESPTILVVTAKQMTGLVVEARTPHSLPWDTPVIMAALHRLRTSVSEPRMKCVAISDGTRLYAAELDGDNLQHRIYVSLVSEVPQAPLWWLSFWGIHRPNPTTPSDPPRLLPFL